MSNFPSLILIFDNRYIDILSCINPRESERLGHLFEEPNIFIKIRYSCTPNMESIVNANNIINSTAQEPDRCNCRNRENCPLPGKCTIKNIIYQATVSTSENKKYYIGQTSTTFKTRYSVHKASFNKKEKRNSTELSKYIWKLKEENTTYQIHWKILRKEKPYTPASKKCNLCFWEKHLIITANRTNTLNSRFEQTSSCRHKAKYLLSAPQSP